MKRDLIVVAILLFVGAGCGKKDASQPATLPPPPVTPSYIDTYNCTVHYTYHKYSGGEATVYYSYQGDSLYIAQLIVDRSKKDSIFISGPTKVETAKFVRTVDGNYHHYTGKKVDWEQTFTISPDSISAIFKLNYVSLGSEDHETKIYTGVKANQ